MISRKKKNLTEFLSKYSLAFNHSSPKLISRKNCESPNSYELTKIPWQFLPCVKVRSCHWKHVSLNFVAILPSKRFHVISSQAKILAISTAGLSCINLKLAWLWQNSPPSILTSQLNRFHGIFWCTKILAILTEGLSFSQNTKSFCSPMQDFYTVSWLSCPTLTEFFQVFI